MLEPPRYLPFDLTRHRAMAPKYYGYTAMDWFKFYGFFAGMILLLAFVYIKYLGLFEDIETQPPEYKLFAFTFSTLALLVVLPAALGFLWWAAGALVRYSLWQQASPRFWRWFWFAVLLFYFTFEFDPLDRIHPAMSRQGLLYVPKLVMLVFDRKLEFTLFQMGYFLMWLLFWFLVVMLHLSYLLRGLEVVWFYTKRFHRYGASLLVGFRETLRTSSLRPVTREPGEQARLRPLRFRGVPALAVADLSADEARAIAAADMSAAIVPAPGQLAVLFIDLGRYDYDPALAELKRADGTPLLAFEDYFAAPAARREDLLVPLRPAAVGAGHVPARSSVGAGPGPGPQEGGDSALPEMQGGDSAPPLLENEGSGGVTPPEDASRQERAETSSAPNEMPGRPWAAPTDAGRISAAPTEEQA